MNSVAAMEAQFMIFGSFALGKEAAALDAPGAAVGSFGLAAFVALGFERPPSFGLLLARRVSLAVAVFG
jgi:hypothetical protein